MDTVGIDTVKVEKANVMINYIRRQKLATLLRVFEVFLALIFLSWSTTSFRLQIDFRIVGSFIREIFNIVVSPRFVFLVGNAIIITLFATSGQFPNQNPNVTSENQPTITDHNQEEILKSDETDRGNAVSDVFCPDYSNVTAISPADRDLIEKVADTVPEPRRYRRTQSAELKVREKPTKVLRRSETNKTRQMGKEEEKVESLSNEEFRRTVEAFIAKQQRFLREESMAIVLNFDAVA
ncbi:protein of unknown function DUF4408 [Dillenia turbinata]|uniref:DUF4408 domain-containing protein n=1 Tax=Dillenia turbinata TaxID=194707 RepID=A0AAN8VRI3_9MAGN